MSENKLNTSNMGLVMSVNECIRLASGTLEVCKEKHKRLRAMQAKRSNQQSMDFFAAIVYHLNKLEKNNE